MQLNGLTRLLDTWADRPVKLLYLLNARALGSVRSPSKRFAHWLVDWLIINAKWK